MRNRLKVLGFSAAAFALPGCAQATRPPVEAAATRGGAAQGPSPSVLQPEQRPPAEQDSPTANSDVNEATPALPQQLPPLQIQSTIRSNYPVFRACYDRGLRNNPSLKGRVVVRFVVVSDGHVSEARALYETVPAQPELPADADPNVTTLPDTEVVNCMVDAYRALTFPPFQDKQATVVYPLVFAPALH